MLESHQRFKPTRDFSIPISFGISPLKPLLDRLIVLNIKRFLSNCYSISFNDIPIES
ncbi:hypothetical protein IC582_027432 [Cucumis melo]